MSVAQLIRYMTDRGADAKAIALAVEAFEELTEAQRAHRREQNRQAQIRHRQRLSAMSDAKILTEEKLNKNNDHISNVSTISDDTANSALSYSSLLGSPSEIQQRKEEQVEGRKRTRTRTTVTKLPSDFEPNEKHFALACSLGKAEHFAVECFEEMRDWSRSNGKMKADWNATLSIWMRRAAKTGPPRVNGYAPRPNSKEESYEIQRSILRSWNPVPQADDGERSEDGRAADDGVLPFPKIGRPRDLPCRAGNDFVRVSKMGGRDSHKGR